MLNFDENIFCSFSRASCASTDFPLTIWRRRKENEFFWCSNRTAVFNASHSKCTLNKESEISKTIPVFSLSALLVKIRLLRWSINGITILHRKNCWSTEWGTLYPQRNNTKKYRCMWKKSKARKSGINFGWFPCIQIKILFPSTQELISKRRDRKERKSLRHGWKFKEILQLVGEKIKLKSWSDKSLRYEKRFACDLLEKRE